MSEQDKAPAQDKPLPIIHIDDDPHNANWLRILEKRRIKREGKQPQPSQPQKEKPSNGRQP